MSIIQKIRDRAAVLLTAMIAISLIGFLVQDAFIGRSGNLFSGQPTTAGSIDGKEIDLVEFSQKVNLVEQNYRSQGMQTDEMMTQTIIENVWNAYVQEELVRNTAENLGLQVTNKEMGAVLFSEEAPQEFKQMFTDRNTGAYDVNAAKNWMNNMKKNSKPEDAQNINEQLIKPIQINLLTQKYTSIFTQGSYVPKWMIEKLNADNASFASISFASVPYTTISDSTVKVSDAEIEEYVGKHKDDFKQEHVKSIAYVSFSATPTTADTQKVVNQLNTLKTEFETTADAKAFVTRNNTQLPFFDGFALKSKIQIAEKEAIFALPTGAVYGPYLDAGSYVLAKKLETKTLPDSVRCRHILVGTVDPQTNQQIRPDSVAKKKIDSVFSVINAGGNFGALALAVSDDQGSKNTGGEYTFTSLDVNLAKEFADFIFNKRVGSREVVKTQFGYHVIEVLSQSKFEEGYKIAYLSKAVVASEETDIAASSSANQFASSAKDVKSFDEAVGKMKVTKNNADNIKELDYTAGSLGSRALVKWVFENKVGSVSEPFDLKDQYVVAVVTNEIEEGVQPATVARVLVEPTIRNKKKAESMSKKAGSEKNLEKLAGLLGGTTGRTDTVRFADPFVPNLGSETKVIGAAFNKKNLSNTSEAIDGQNGVYFITVNQVGALPSAAVDLEGQRKALQNQMKQYAGYSTMESLKKATKIVDKRREAGY
ncbi:MAG: peptidylprolyl isomerase [Chitinophagia bacterium]